MEFHCQLKNVDFVKLAILIWMRRNQLKKMLQNWTCSENVDWCNLLNDQIFLFFEVFDQLNIFFNWFVLIGEFYTEINVIHYLSQNVNFYKFTRNQNYQKYDRPKFSDPHIILNDFWFPDIQENQLQFFLNSDVN